MELNDRLKHILENKKISQKAIALALGVGQSTVSGWISGRQEPDTENRKKLCKFLGISEATLFEDIDMLKESTASYGVTVHKTPLISWAHANHFFEITDPFPKGAADEFVYTCVKGENIFALKVIHDCMEPEFIEGDIIIIKPNIDINNGDFIIVANRTKNEATFKQYKKYGEKIILHPLNPKYPDIEMDHDERFVIVGKVVEKIKKY